MFHIKMVSKSFPEILSLENCIQVTHDIRAHFREILFHNSLSIYLGSQTMVCLWLIFVDCIVE